MSDIVRRFCGTATEIEGEVVEVCMMEWPCARHGRENEAAILRIIVDRLGITPKLEKSLREERHGKLEIAADMAADIFHIILETATTVSEDD